MNNLTLAIRGLIGRTMDIRDDALDFLTQRSQPRQRLPELANLSPVNCGRGDGRWTMCKKGLSKESVVYSVGVGFDISFDLDVIELFGCQVHAFDPTQISTQWLERQKNLPSLFQHHNLGLAHYSGMANFKLPQNHSVSFSMSDSIEGGKEHQAEVKTLGDLMASLNHQRIDLLKIDIEGAEYQIINDLAERSGQISQLLIEFHDRLLPPSSPTPSEVAVKKLGEAGFKLYNVSRRGNEYSFIGPAFFEMTRHQINHVV